MRDVAWLESSAKHWVCVECEFAQIGFSQPEIPLCLVCRERLSTGPGVPSFDELLERAGVPWRFRRGWDLARWCTAFGVEFAELNEEVAAWRPRSDQSILLLVGSPNGGKTGLATLLLGRELAAGKTGAWVRSQALLDAVVLALEAERAVSATAARYAADRLALDHRCRGVDVLVIDDLFASGRATPAARERAQAVIAERYDEGQQTVVTTNRTLGELVAILPSLESRLSSGVVIPLDGRTNRRSA